MSSFKNTREVAEILGVSSSRLARAIWDRRFDPPAKGPGGAFLWTEQDIRRASWALLSHNLNEIVLKKFTQEECNHDM